MINKYQICSPHICNWASFNQLPPHASCKYKWIYIYPKGLGAESARAVTGRRCPRSGEGEDFLMGQPDFFTKTAVTPEQKVEKSIPRWEMNGHSEGYKRAVDQNWGCVANIGFLGQKPRFWAQKNIHFFPQTMFRP